MIERIVMELGAWNWMALGLVLLALEIMVPGIFLLWIGVAAIIVGSLTLMIGGAAMWTWQLQIVLFLVLSLVSAYIGKKVMGKGDGASDEPLLNQRAEQLVGRTATLVEPITNGRGRVKLGDTQWRVNGPDLPVGTTVKVVSAKDSELSVAAV
jgi:inner membrane protein